MRLLLRWVWKLIPHRHIDVVTGGFILGSIFEDYRAYECVRCGRPREDEEHAVIMAKLRKAGKL